MKRMMRKSGVKDKEKIIVKLKVNIKKENTVEISISKENNQVEEREDIVIGRNAVIEDSKRR